MPLPSHRKAPCVELLEPRIVLTSAPSSVPTPIPSNARLIPGEFPSANPHRSFTTSDLEAYATAYESLRGTSAYTPEYDFNGTGFIGQNDATPILRGLAAVTPKVPLKVVLALAPGEQIKGHHPANSGGVTRDAIVTIVGKTTPNSIVFVDGVTGAAHNSTIGLFKFEGGAVATDSRGKFTFRVTVSPDAHSGSLGVTSFLIRTPFGQQTIRTFPVLRIR